MAASLIKSLEDQLRRDEGSRSSVYPDSRGYWTIGIGTCIDARVGCGLSDDEIDYLFQNRKRLAIQVLQQEFPWTAALDEVRRGVLENMTFQMGLGHLAEFRNMLAALQVGDFATAAKHGRDSDWWRSQSPARAERLMRQLETGEWQ